MAHPLSSKAARNYTLNEKQCARLTTLIAPEAITTFATVALDSQDNTKMMGREVRDAAIPSFPCSG